MNCVCLGTSPHGIARRFQSQHRFQGLFQLGITLFRRGPTSARCTHVQFKTAGQIRLEFMTPTQNGRRAHAGDLHQHMLAAMAESHRFQCDELAPLWLIEPAEKDVHVMMKGLIRMRFCGLAKRAFAMMTGE